MLTADRYTFRSLSRCSRDQSGAAAINVLFLFPLILVLTVGILQVGFWMTAALVGRSAVQHAVTLTAQGVPPDVARQSADQLIARSGVARNRVWEVGPAVSDTGVAHAGLLVSAVKILPGPWKAYAVDTHQTYASPDRRVSA